MHAENLYRNAFELMQSNVSLFEELIRDYAGLSSLQGFPVFTSDDPSLYGRLLSEKILISSFPYPLPQSPLLNRIVITAAHIKEDLYRLVRCKLLK